MGAMQLLPPLKLSALCCNM